MTNLDQTGPAREDAKLLKVKTLYLAELRRIMAATARGRRGIRHILDYTETCPVARHQPNGGETWVWSDLHLRHGNIIKYCDRPFASADEMDLALMNTWRSMVAEGDTVLNGGDIALAGRLRTTDRAAIRNAPGRKRFVVGNHDFNKKTWLLDASGHDTASGILVIESDPPMVLTHVPMGPIPPGWVNLYGHVHNNEPLRDSPHINVCVEHTEYKPLRLESLTVLARQLLTRGLPEGATTADRIRRAEATAGRAGRQKRS